MASSGKKKTTMAKLARENKLRERRVNKQAKRDARKASADHPHQPEDALSAAPSETAKAFSLRRLRDAPDEELAVFEDRLRQDALAAGATEQELREAQVGHPGHS